MTTDIITYMINNVPEEQHEYFIKCVKEAERMDKRALSQRLEKMNHDTIATFRGHVKLAAFQQVELKNA